MNDQSNPEISESRVERTPVLFSDRPCESIIEIIANLAKFRYALGTAPSLERKFLTDEQQKFLFDLIESTEPGSPESKKLFHPIGHVEPNDPDIAILINVPREWSNRSNELFFSEEVPALKNFRIEEEGV